MRIVVDMVMNHTSDAHPWFQASRSDPEGPYGDFYVWSDDTERYPDARIIFVDTEASNWTFDPVRRQYFWHRFFSHQPDLNFENPYVREAMKDVAPVLAGHGHRRLPARRGALPVRGGGHQLREPAAHPRLPAPRCARWSTRSSPAGSCSPRPTSGPRTSCDYFGTDEAPECHMCFHFPVMPRIFYAIRDQRADGDRRHPRRHPAVPAGGQWGTFLRNHDELTLEMVSTEERASMYGWYAPDPRMRANIGIRRRLAPLLDNSRAEIELAHALLLSLPGSPCLYYGDEIGMGDNIWLPDRDAVRTPMQWTPDRNAGFSTADPGKLYLPVVQSLVHHYTTPTSSRSSRRRRRCCTGCTACSRSVGSTPCSAPATTWC